LVFIIVQRPTIESPLPVWNERKDAITGLSNANSARDDNIAGHVPTNQGLSVMKKVSDDENGHACSVIS
jgi:hypothetical protein